MVAVTLNSRNLPRSVTFSFPERDNALSIDGLKANAFP